jgi:hypothetical protein
MSANRRSVRIGWVLGLVAACNSTGGGGGDGNGMQRGLAAPAAAGASANDAANSGAGSGGTDGAGNGLFNTNTMTMGLNIPQKQIDEVECEVGTMCYDNMIDDTDCGSLRLEPEVEMIVEREPGNILVIFDQSVSMSDPAQGGTWGNTTKLQAAQNALVQAMTPLQNDLTAGAIFFPTLDCDPFLGVQVDGGSVQPIEMQFPFQPGPDFLAAWQAKFAAPGQAPIGTPLAEAMDRADVAINAALGTLTGPLAVLVFTDGEPNCIADPAFTGVPHDFETMRAYTWLTDHNIKTYVVGLPGSMGVQVLQDIAYYGGTNTYITPDDPAVLQMELSKIVTETVTEKIGFNSCSITLNPPADVPDELAMVVEEGGMLFHMPHMQGTDPLWTISPDGMHVELLGPLCQRAQEGYYASINFEFACEPLPPPPPLPVPD